MSGSSSEIETARADMDAARHDVMESETEIQTIKNLLRQITSSSDQGTSSTLAISALTVRPAYAEMTHLHEGLLGSIFSYLSNFWVRAGLTEFWHL